MSGDLRDRKIYLCDRLHFGGNIFRVGDKAGSSISNHIRFTLNYHFIGNQFGVVNRCTNH